MSYLVEQPPHCDLLRLSLGPGDLSAIADGRISVGPRLEFQKTFVNKFFLSLLASSLPPCLFRQSARGWHEETGFLQGGKACSLPIVFRHLMGHFFTRGEGLFCTYCLFAKSARGWHEETGFLQGGKACSLPILFRHLMGHFFIFYYFLLLLLSFFTPDGTLLCLCVCRVGKERDCVQVGEAATGEYS